jgi:hypothetical protein
VVETEDIVSADDSTASRSAARTVKIICDPEPVLAGQFLSRLDISNRDVDVGAHREHGRLAGVVYISREVPGEHEITGAVYITKLVDQVTIGRRHRFNLPRRVDTIEVT